MNCQALSICHSICVFIKQSVILSVWRSGCQSVFLCLSVSINLITLMALILSIGLVVDDAIVVVENIFHHIEQGETP